MFWDTTYILVILGAVLCAAASWNISQTYRRYSAFSNARGLTAEAVAAMIPARRGHSRRADRAHRRLADRPLFARRKGAAPFRQRIRLDLRCGHWRRGA